MFKYLPQTEIDISLMLKTIGLKSLDDLFLDIPSSIRLRKPYNILPALSESQLRQQLKNPASVVLKSFRGFGSYEHERPSIIDSISSRQEFLTSYTPYQPEVGQGTLQYIFEFQSMMTSLTGMDVCNASMYDGPTSLAEAMIMAVSYAGNKRILVDENLLPHVLEVIKTNAFYREVEIVIIPSINGLIDRKKAFEIMKESFACLIVGYPNKFGLIDQFGDLSKMVHNMNALLISYADPFLLSVLKSPIDYEADIVCGEAQSLGLSLNFGGPYLGYLTAKKYLVRKMPGRIVGATTDNRGQRAFVLTLQAREQHIRRERANSNICSNQSLLALQATIYMSSLGKNGLQKAASNAIAGAHYLHDKLIATALFKPSFVSSFGQETTLKYQLDIHKLNEKLMVKGYLGPQPINDHEGVFFVSEMKTKDDIDQFITAIEEISHDLQ